MARAWIQFLNPERHCIGNIVCIRLSFGIIVVYLKMEFCSCIH